jgi:hypothetical protein
MLNEALKQLRTSMLAAFLLSIVWTLALPTTVSELRARQGAEQLASWLLLKATFAEIEGAPVGVEEFRERFVSRLRDGRILDSEMKEPPPEAVDPRPGADNLPSPQPLTIRPLWPEEKTEVAIRLEPWPTVMNKYQIYQIQSDARFLPFSQYAVVLDTTHRCRDCLKVLARESWTRGAREVDLSFYRRYEPVEWDEIRPRMWASTGSLNVAADLHLTDPPVVAFFKEAYNARHSLWGLTLDSGLFFVAPGILLGAQALLLIGAMMVLARERRSSADQLWIMAWPTASPPNPLLEALLVVLSLCWVALPAGILAAQIAQGVHLHPFERACYWLGAVGLALTIAVNAVAMYLLGRLRRASRLPDS